MGDGGERREETNFLWLSVKVSSDPSASSLIPVRSTISSGRTLS